MEKHVALAKANLRRAKAQYEAAQQLYNNALELQSANRELQVQSQVSLDNRSKPGSLAPDTVSSPTKGANDIGDVRQSASVLCDICKASVLIRCFIDNTWPRPKRLLLGDLSDCVGKRDVCALCRFLVQASELFPASESSISAATTPIKDPATSNQVRIVQGRTKFSWPKVAGCTLNVPVTPFAWLELGNNPRIEFKGAPYVCITLDPSQHIQQDRALDELHCPNIRSSSEQFTGLINYDMIKSWIEICTTRHQTNCAIVHHDEHDKISTTPIYLIDVKSRKVEVAPPSARYIALSYVWGDEAARASNQSISSSSTAKQLLIRGESSKRQLPEVLPQTLEDALTLAEAMGERFVWIDRYCIDQNNPTEVEEQVSIMDRIFRQAWLTVIALVSDTVESGIKGISQPMQRRKQPTLTLPQGRLIATHVEFTREHAGNSPWDRRAWTLQEFVLSRRCLILSDYHVSMKCHEGFFHDMIPINTPMSWSETKLDDENWWENVYAINLGAKEWDFKDYDGLVSIYSGRQLRYQSDALRACRGSLNQITQDTGMAFTFGIPVKDLYRALLWKAHNEVCIRRRRWYNEGRQSWESFPSWTCAGWQGRTECDYWIGDMAAYVDQEANDEIRILNRRGRKRPRTESSCSERQPESYRAQIVAYPKTEELYKPFLIISSAVATCRIQRVRKHNTKYQIFKNGAKRELTSIGDHWTLLEPDTSYTIRDIAGEEEAFGKRDHFFRSDASIPEKLEENGCKVELLMIGHWPLIRDSQESNTWLQDMVSYLVILRGEDQVAWRIAAILLEEETWKRFSPVPAEVNLG